MEENEEFNRWLKVAKIDLVDAKVHYGEKNYSYSLYNLQQANEKLAKAIFIKIGLSSENGDTPLKENFREYGVNVISPKKYKHKWSNEFLEQVKSILTSEKSPVSQDFFEGFKISDPGESLEKAKKAQKINESDSHEIEDTINRCYNLLEVALDDKSADKNRAKLMDLDIDSIISLMEKNSHKKVNIPNKSNSKKKVFQLTYCVEVHLLLSRILDQFEENRYPNQKDYTGFVPFILDIDRILLKCLQIISQPISPQI